MNSITSVFRIVRDFLFSNINKQFLTFLFFLSLSGIFWMMLTLVETYEKELKIPVQISQIPNNVVLTSDDVDTVRITVRDRGWMILSYLYGNQLKRVYANFKNYNRGNGYGVIPANELMKLIHAQNPIMTSKITSIKPEKLEYFYNDGAHKRVPVRWSGRVIPEHLYFISQTQYWPDSVDVYASPGKLDSITVAYTETLYGEVGDCALFKIFACVCAFRRHEHGIEEPTCVTRGFYDALLFDRTLARTGIIFFYGNARAVCKRFYGGGVVQTFCLHDKCHRVTAGAAAETVIALCAGEHRERRCLFGMERAKPHKIASGAL